MIAADLQGARDGCPVEAALASLEDNAGDNTPEIAPNALARSRRRLRLCREEVAVVRIAKHLPPRAVPYFAGHGVDVVGAMDLEIASEKQ